MTLFSLFPPVFVSDGASRENAESRPFWITMFARAESNAAVLAQEMRELGLKWIIMAAASLIWVASGWACWAGHVGIGAPVAGFALFCLAMLLPTKLPPLVRWLELRGHETEVQALVALYGQDEANERRDEALSMIRGYGDVFASWPVEKIEAAMRKQSAGAKRYVDRKRKKLDRFKRDYR